MNTSSDPAVIEIIVEFEGGARTVELLSGSAHLFQYSEGKLLSVEIYVLNVNVRIVVTAKGDNGNRP